MTPSDKPKRSDSRSQQDADSTSVMTQAADDSSAATPAKDSAEHSGRSEESTAAAAADDSGEPGDVRSEQAEAQGRGGETRDGTEGPPPWQRASSASDASGAGAGTGGTGPGVPGASGATTGPAKPNPDAEETQTIPHPLRDMGQPPPADAGTAADQEADGSARSGRTTVSFAGSAAGRSSASASSSSGRRPSRGPRRASLQLKRLDPWSVLKLALVLSVTLFFVWMIAIAVLYGVLGGMGVWDQLNGTFSELTQPENTVGEPLISAGRVFGVASIIGAINIVLITALATVAAFIYNVAADLVGGVEVTLSERE